jgi:hypothetical protein
MVVINHKGKEYRSKYLTMEELEVYLTIPMDENKIKFLRLIGKLVEVDVKDDTRLQERKM